jgi:hypothetical protein
MKASRSALLGIVPVLILAPPRAIERSTSNLLAEFGGLNGAVMSGGAGTDHYHVVMLCRTIRSVHRTYSPVEVGTNEKQ